MPTMAEFLPGFEITSWGGICAPAAVPPGDGREVLGAGQEGARQRRREEGLRATGRHGDLDEPRRHRGLPRRGARSGSRPSSRRRARRSSWTDSQFHPVRNLRLPTPRAARLTLPSGATVRSLARLGEVEGNGPCVDMGNVRPRRKAWGIFSSQTVVLPDSRSLADSASKLRRAAEPTSSSWTPKSSTLRRATWTQCDLGRTLCPAVRSSRRLARDPGRSSGTTSLTPPQRRRTGGRSAAAPAASLPATRAVGRACATAGDPSMCSQRQRGSTGNVPRRAGSETRSGPRRALGSTRPRSRRSGAPPLPARSPVLLLAGKLPSGGGRVRRHAGQPGDVAPDIQGDSLRAARLRRGVMLDQIRKASCPQFLAAPGSCAGSAPMPSPIPMPLLARP